MSRFASKLWLCLFTLTAISCTSMQAVQTYSTVSRNTLFAVRPVARDFYHSCIRANAYKPLASLSECSQEQKAYKAIMKVTDVLNRYIASLGALAVDDLVYYDQDIDRLKNEIDRLQILDPAKVASLGHLANFIAQASTRFYQQDQVAAFITESNTSVDQVANMLADLIEQNYTHALSLEMSAWKDSYRKAEKTSRDSKPLAWEDYSQRQMRDRARIQDKWYAAKDLATGIRKIALTHSLLTQDAQQLNSQEVAAAVKSFVIQVQPIIEDMQTRF